MQRKRSTFKPFVMAGEDTDHGYRLLGAAPVGVPPTGIERKS